MLYKSILFAVFAMLFALPVTAQSEEDKDPPERATEVPTEGGFWPTPRMVERLIDRITEDGIGLYTFDEIQLDQTRTILRERVPRWLAENRAEVMSLTNEMLEALLDKEPPSPETMAKWAGRVLPVIDGFEKEVVAITDDMREFLTDDQLTVLDGEVAAFSTGLSLATNKMRDWADGRFDPKVDWPTGDDFDEAEAEQQRVAERAQERAKAIAEGQPDPYPEDGPATVYTPEATVVVEPTPERPTSRSVAPAAPVDAWTRYTDEFIRKYEMNSDQQSKARNHLRTAQANRDSYLSKPKTVREKSEVEALLESAKNATGEEAAKRLADAESRKKKLDAPVENEFARLKEKLDKELTREQRRKALAAAGTSASQPTETANAAPENPQSP